MATQVERAAQAVCLAAERLGLTGFSPVILGGYSNTLIRLAPHPIVARVATATDAHQGFADVMAREIAVAEALGKIDAPSVRTSSILAPGPHCEMGLHLSFWDYVEVTSDIPSPADAGAMLRHLHDALDAITEAELHPLTPFHTAAAIAAGPLGDRLDVEARRLVRTMFERAQKDVASITALRPLHGDAHYGNLWVTRNGVVWGDFEDTCAGPIEWDLACLVASSIVLGTGSAAAEALTAYGKPYDAARLDLLVMARTLQAIAWALVALEEIDRNPRLLARLEWIRSRA